MNKREKGWLVKSKSQSKRDVWAGLARGAHHLSNGGTTFFCCRLYTSVYLYLYLYLYFCILILILLILMFGAHNLSNGGTTFFTLLLLLILIPAVWNGETTFCRPFHSRVFSNMCLIRIRQTILGECQTRIPFLPAQILNDVTNAYMRYLSSHVSNCLAPVFYQSKN